MVDWNNKLVQVSEKSDSEHVSYDEARAEWVFKVKHFTKYGLDLSDSDEDEAEEEQAKPVE
jgi:nuclear pore complex protein Nup98-Nup96